MNLIQKKEIELYSIKATRRKVFDILKRSDWQQRKLVFSLAWNVDFFYKFCPNFNIKLNKGYKLYWDVI